MVVEVKEKGRWWRGLCLELVGDEESAKHGKTSGIGTGKRDRERKRD